MKSKKSSSVNLLAYNRKDYTLSLGDKYGHKAYYGRSTSKIINNQRMIMTRKNLVYQEMTWI